MDPEFIKALAEQGISVVLAGVVMYWYRADSKERLAEAKSDAAKEREDKLLMLGALQDNTRVIGELKHVIEHSCRDRLVIP